MFLQNDKSKTLTIHGIVANMEFNEFTKTELTNCYSISVIDKYSNDDLGFKLDGVKKVNKNNSTNIVSFKLIGSMDKAEEEILGLIIKDNRSGYYEKIYFEPFWTLKGIWGKKNL